MNGHKIATCCYCGTRAALVLCGKSRHELSCSSCGAPLHDMKMLRSDHHGQPDLVKPSKIRDTHRKKPSKKYKKKRRKGLGAYILDEALDVLDDIFD